MGGDQPGNMVPMLDVHNNQMLYAIDSSAKIEEKWTQNNDKCLLDIVINQADDDEEIDKSPPRRSKGTKNQITGDSTFMIDPNNTAFRTGSSMDSINPNTLTSH
jgi:hypothetical protein